MLEAHSKNSLASSGDTGLSHPQSPVIALWTRCRPVTMNGEYHPSTSKILAAVLTKWRGVVAVGKEKSSTAIPKESVIRFQRRPRNLVRCSPSMTGGSPTRVG